MFHEEKFDMADLGQMGFFLGIEVIQILDGISICQGKYSCNNLKINKEINE